MFVSISEINVLKVKFYWNINPNEIIEKLILNQLKKGMYHWDTKIEWCRKAGDQDT